MRKRAQLRPPMNTDLYIAGIMGIAPALALMFWTLRDYTYPKVEKPFFNDVRVFLLLAIGMVIGVVMIAVQNLFDVSVIASGIVFGLLFAIIWELVKLVFLNMPRLQKRLDTPFYGLALGLGIGAMMGFGAAALTFNAFSSGKVPVPWDTYVVLAIIAVQFVLLNGSTTATIGIGVARGLPFSYFSQAAMVHIVFNMIMVPFYAVIEVKPPINYIFLAAATVLVAWYYYHVHSRLLPDLIARELKKFARKTKVTK
jgi:hypothetical protein